MHSDTRKIFDANAAGTQLAPPANPNGYYEGMVLKHAHDVGFIVVHPGGTTTTYQVQVSNLTDDDVRAGLDDWSNYTGNGALPTPTLNLNAATKANIELTNLGFARVRLQLVTTVGNGEIIIRGHAKSRGGV